MKDILKKAYEGGWTPKGMKEREVRDIDGELVGMHYQKDVSEFEIVCDPLFWQALGKACGWKRWFEMTSNGCNTEEPEIILGDRGNEYGYSFDGDDKEDFSLAQKATPEWKYRALRFHEINLTEGWEKAVEYLEDSTKK